MKHPQTGGYNTWNDAVRAQRERCGFNPSPAQRHAPSHGGYPDPVEAEASRVLGNLPDTNWALGNSKQTCPDCRRDYVCPYHRTH